jgi:hypothetical protein
MRGRSYLLFLAALLVPALCSAQTVCPWINRATATDSPDGIVREAHAALADGGSRCLFSYSDGDVAYNVQITVRNTIDSDQDMTRPEAQCTSAQTSLTGIGNEALLCAKDMHYSRGEQVIGRVRDKIFVVVVSTREGRESPAARRQLSDKALLIAEQVAGNLF